MESVTYQIPHVPNDKASFLFIVNQFKMANIGRVEKVTFANHPRASSYSCSAQVMCWGKSVLDPGQDLQLWLRDSVTLEKTGRYWIVRALSEEPKEENGKSLSRSQTLRNGLCYLE